MKIAASITPHKTKFGPLLFSENIDNACALLKDIGFDGVELSLRDPSTIDLHAIERTVNSRGLDVVAIATGQSYIEDGLSLYGGDEVLRELCVQRIKKHIEFAEHFGSSVIIGGIRGNIPRIEYRQQYRDLGDNALRVCAEYAAKLKITLLLEPINRYETNMFNRVEEAYEWIMANGYEMIIKILPDAFHMNIEEANIIDTILRYKQGFGAFHCADSNRLVPGLGHTDFLEIIRALQGSDITYLGIEALPLPDNESAARIAYQTIRGILKNLSMKE